MELEIMCPHCTNPYYYEEDYAFLSEDLIYSISCGNCSEKIYFDLKKTVKVNTIAKTEEEIDLY